MFLLASAKLAVLIAIEPLSTLLGWWIEKEKLSSLVIFFISAIKAILEDLTLDAESTKLLAGLDISVLPIDAIPVIEKLSRSLFWALRAAKVVKDFEPSRENALVPWEPNKLSLSSVKPAIRVSDWLSGFPISTEPVKAFLKPKVWPLLCSTGTVAPKRNFEFARL